MMYPVALFMCAVPNSTEAKVMQLYRVVKLRQKKGMEQAISILPHGLE